MEFKDLLKQYADGSADEQSVLDAYEKATEGMVPRTRLNDKAQDIKELQEEIAKRDEQIAELQNSVKDESEISKELEQLKEENAKWSDKYQQTQLNNAIKVAVAKEANDPNDVLALLDKTQLSLNEAGEVDGLDDVIGSLKETKPYLFTAAKPTGKTPVDGKGVKQTMSKEQFDQLTFDQKQELYLNDKETFNQLTQ